jgi:hypothetical protein
VLEILTYNKYNEDVSLYSTEYRMHLELMEKVCRNVIVNISRSIAQEAADGIVSEFSLLRELINPLNKLFLIAFLRKEMLKTQKNQIQTILYPFFRPRCSRI